MPYTLILDVATPPTLLMAYGLPILLLVAVAVVCIFAIHAIRKARKKSLTDSDRENNRL